MNNLFLSEFPNIDTLEKLTRHSWVHEEHRDMLYSYLLEAQKKDGKVSISYIPKKHKNEPLGRLYSSKPHMCSAQNMWSRCRSALFSETELDIDMVNCHPKLLLSMCKKSPDHFSTETYSILQKYCENRQAMFDDIYIDQTVIDEYNDKNFENKTKNDFLKVLFTINLYGGSLSTWEKSFDLNSQDYELSEDFEKLQYDMQYIAKTIVKIHPKGDIAREMYKQKVKKKMSKKCYENKEDGEIRIKEPKPHKLLAYLLQDEERKIITKAIKRAQAFGLTVTCYAYDGFQILKDSRAEEFIQSINNPDNGCEFIIKPFKKPVPLDEKYLFEKKDDSFCQITMWRIGFKQTYDNDTNTYTLSPTSFQDMGRKKEYFERYMFFCDTQKKVVQKMPSGFYNYITPSQANEYFANVEYIDTKGKRQPFIKWWLKQVDRKSYEKMECLPPPCKTPNSVFNLWNGFEIEEEEYDPEADFSILLDHFKHISGNDDAVYEYLLNWFAWKVQFPGKKTEVCIILYTEKEGAGKGFIAEEIMKSFLGKYHNEYFSTIGSFKDITDRFNNIAEKLVAVLNEAKGSDSYGIIDRVKDFITQKTFNKELKGCTMERGLRALCDIILTTNNDNCMKISETDRRFCIIECDESIVGNYQYFKNLWATLDNKPAMRGFFEFLKNRDLKNFVPQMDKPKTKIYEEFAKASLSPIAHFWAEEYQAWNDNEEDNNETAKIIDYWDKFQNFYENNYPGKQHHYTVRTFSKSSRKLDGIYDEAVAKKIGGRTFKCFIITWNSLEELYKKSL